MWWPDFFLSPLLVPVSVMIICSLHTGSRSGIERINAAVEKDADLLVSSVQELVRIKSVAGDPLPGAPFGRGPADALQKTLALAENLGFRTKNLDNYIGYAEYGEGDEYVAVLGHLDTVPEGSTGHIRHSGVKSMTGRYTAGELSTTKARSSLLSSG